MDERVKRYCLYIDIEAENAEYDCWRPVDYVLLCDSPKESVIEDLWAEIQNFKQGDWELRKKGKMEYTVFIYKTDDEDSEDFYEEWNMGRYMSLKRAKGFMNLVVKKFGKGLDK